MTDKVETTNLAAMTDEEIMNMDEGDIVVAPVEEEEEDAGGGSPADDTDDNASEQDNPDDDTGGADDDEDSSKDVDESGDPSADDKGSDDDLASDDDGDDDSVKADQAKDKDDSDNSEDEQDDTDQTFEAKYNQLMAPFRAAKREIKLDNIEDARRLLKMGVDYSQKMQRLKPQLRILRTLEKAKLTDPSRINFLIDLAANKPEAIRKLLKDNDIDPLTLNLKDSEDYTPTDHAVGDAELEVRDVLDNIKDDPDFDKTFDIITKKLDKASRTILQERPEIIAELHEHIGAGVYDKVQERVANERVFGRLKGLSDLDAYYQVGDQMFQAGELPNSPQPDSASADDDKPKGAAQDSGSDAEKAEKIKADKAKLRNRKRAAKSPRGRSAKAGKKIPDFSKMSDKEIEELDISSF